MISEDYRLLSILQAKCKEASKLFPGHILGPFIGSSKLVMKNIV